MSHPPSNAAPPAPLVPLLSAVEWRGLRPMASAPGQIQPACGGMAEGHVGRRIARGYDKRRDCAPPTDPDPGVVTPVCERRSANRSATRGRGLVGAQALERHQMHSEAGAGARAGSVLTHRVGGFRIPCPFRRASPRVTARTMDHFWNGFQCAQPSGLGGLTLTHLRARWLMNINLVLLASAHWSRGRQEHPHAGMGTLTI